MGITKTEGFSTTLQEKAEVLKALGHPGRFAIVELLAKKATCIGNEIVNEIPLAQPTISKHLAELKKTGLVRGSIEGKNSCFCLDQERWQELQQWINTIAEQINEPKTYCSTN